ncbi:MAG: tape measure protein [Cyanobacteria bacterium P01_F01_bin.56]
MANFDGTLTFGIEIDQQSINQALNRVERAFSGQSIDIGVGQQLQSDIQVAARGVQQQLNSIQAPRLQLFEPTELDRIRAEFNDLARRRIELELITDVPSQLNRIDSEIAGLQNSRIKLDVDVAGIQANLNRVDSDIRRLTGELEAELKLDTAESLQRVETLTNRIDQLDARRLRLDFRNDQAVRGIAEIDQRLEGLQDERINIDVNARNAVNEIGQIDNRLEELRDEARRTQSETKGLSTSITSLGVAIKSAAVDLLIDGLRELNQAVIRFIGTSLEANQQLIGFGIGLDAALDGASTAGAELDFVRDTVRELGGDLETATSAYTSLTAASSQSGISQSLVRDTFEETTRVLGVFNRNTVQSEKAFLALEQIAGKNRVQLEELRGQLGEQLPVAIGATARGLAQLRPEFDGTQESLFNLIGPGGPGLDAETFFKAFTLGLQDIEGEITPTRLAISRLGNQIFELQAGVGQALEPLQTAFLNLAASVFESTGQNFDGFESLISAGERLNNVIVNTPEIADQIGAALAELANTGVTQLTSVVDALTALALNEDAIAGLADTLRDVGTAIQFVGRLAQGVIGLVEVFASLRTQVEESNRAIQFAFDVATVGPFVAVLKQIIDGIQRIRAELGLVESISFDTVLEDDAGADLARQVNRSLEVAAQNINSSGIRAAIDEQAQATKESLGEITSGYEQLTAELEVEQAKQRAVLLESGATQEEVAQLEAQQLQARIDQAKSKLAELSAVNQGALNAEDLAGLQEEILETEKQIADDRVSLAEQTAQNVEDAQNAALENLADATDAALAEIEASQFQRLASIKQQQIDGVLTAAEAEEQIAGLSADTTDRIIEERQRELNELQRLKAEGIISEEQFAEQSVDIQADIANATIERLDLEIAAQERARQVELERNLLANDLAQGALNQQTSLLGAQAELAQALADVEEQRLQSAIAAADAAGNETQANQLRVQLTNQQSQATQEQFDIKRQQLQLEGRLNELEAERALIQARGRGASSEEIALLQQQLSTTREINALNLQTLNAQESLALDQINEQLNEELGTRKDINEEISRQADLQSQLAENQARITSTVAGAFSTDLEGREGVDDIQSQLQAARNAGLFSGETAEFNRALQDVERSLGGSDTSILRAGANSEDQELFADILSQVGRGDLGNLLNADAEINQLKEAQQPIVDELKTLNSQIIEAINSTNTVFNISTNQPEIDLAQLERNRQQQAARRGGF